MGAGGFVSGQDTQSEQAVLTIALVMGVGTLVMLAFGAWMAIQFKLNSRTHAILIDEIERFRSGERTPSSPEAKAVVEDLSGWSYDQLWGNNPVARK
jgi:oligogalacturonide transporter